MRNLIFVLLALALIGLVLSCSPLAAPVASAAPAAPAVST